MLDCKVTVVVQLLSHVHLSATPWTAARQASLSTISRSLLKFMSIELLMPSKHHQGLFQRVGSSHQVVKVLELQLQHQSFQ